MLNWWELAVTKNMYVLWLVLASVYETLILKTVMRLYHAAAHILTSWYSCTRVYETVPGGDTATGR